MKKLSLGVLAILLAGATVFANGPKTKTAPAPKKAKQECICPSGKCIKDGKTVDCPNPASCPDKANCHAIPCTDKSCS
jgi:hypothetical protein